MPHINGNGSHSSNLCKHQHIYNRYPCTYIYCASHLHNMLHGHQPHLTPQQIQTTPGYYPHSQTCSCIFTQTDPLRDRKSSITHACHTHGLANRPLQAAHLLSGLGRGPLFTRTHTLVKLITCTVIHGRFHDIFLQVRISSSSLPSYMFSIAAFSNIPHQCTAHLGAL